jgi:hypothetical protein
MLRPFRKRVNPDLQVAPAPVVADAVALQGTPLEPIPPADYQVLTAIGGKWKPEAPTGGSPSPHGSSAHTGAIGGEGQVEFSPSTGHAHTGSDSKAVAHGNLADKGSNTHDQLDSHLGSSSNPHGVTASQVGAIPTGEKAASGGVASLNSSTLVVQDPASASATPGASKIRVDRRNAGVLLGQQQRLRR